MQEIYLLVTMHLVPEKEKKMLAFLDFTFDVSGEIKLHILPLTSNNILRNIISKIQRVLVQSCSKKYSK